MYFIITVIIILNVIAFIAFAADKYFSLNGKRRIREKTLLLLAIAGGSVGALFAQKIFRHKTQKFKGILWIVLTVQTAVFWGLYRIIS